VPFGAGFLATSFHGGWTLTQSSVAFFGYFVRSGAETHQLSPRSGEMEPICFNTGLNSSSQSRKSSGHLCNSAWRTLGMVHAFWRNQPAGGAIIRYWLRNPRARRRNRSQVPVRLPRVPFYG